MVQRTKDQNTLIVGDWNAQCDRCDFKFKASDLRKEWNGLYTCQGCWEPRHPQDFLRGVPDDPSVPWSRPVNLSDTSATDVAGNSITTDNSIDLHGDVSATIEIDTDHTIHIWNETLTANRAVTLSLTNASYGDMFTIYRNATVPGAFTLNVGGIKIVPADVNALVVVVYRNVWQLSSYTTLGL